MKETVTLYTCDLCFLAEHRGELHKYPTPNWTLIPIVKPWHLCPQCSGLARKLFGILSIPFDFEERDHYYEFNILKVRDLSALFPKPVTDEKVTPTPI